MPEKAPPPLPAQESDGGDGSTPGMLTAVLDLATPATPAAPETAAPPPLPEQTLPQAMPEKAPPPLPAQESDGGDGSTPGMLTAVLDLPMGQSPTQSSTQ